MLTRTEITRAMLASELDSESRLLMLVLLAHASPECTDIPLEFPQGAKHPSISWLARPAWITAWSHRPCAAYRRPGGYSPPRAVGDRVGIKLVAEVLYHAPADFTAQQRLLLVVLAESARDDTRTCWPSMEALTERTGLSARQVRRVLAELAVHGYEIRVPSGTDRRGMPVFASKGHRTVYRVPAFAQRGTHTTALPTPKEDAHDRLYAPKAVKSGHQRRSNWSQRRSYTTTLPLMSPQTIPQIIRAHEPSMRPRRSSRPCGSGPERPSTNTTPS